MTCQSLFVDAFARPCSLAAFSDFAARRPPSHSSRKRPRPKPQSRIPRLMCRSSTAPRRSNATGSPTPPPRTCRSWPATASHTGRPRRNSVRRWQHAPPRREHHRGLSVGRAGAAARRPDPPLHPRRRCGACRIASTPPSASALITQPGEYRVAMLHGAREGEIELAVMRGSAELVNDDGRRRCALASAPMHAPTPRPRTPTSSIPRPGTASIAGRKRGAISGSASRRNTCRTKCARTPPSFERYGAWRYDASYGYVWYPTCRRRLASVLQRPLGHAAAVRLDVGRRRSVGVADASLRALGRSRPARGSGFPGAAGRRPGCRGRTRPAM